jgi:hypothetical protein
MAITTNCPGRSDRWLLVPVSRPECPVEIAQPDVEFCS